MIYRRLCQRDQPHLSFNVATHAPSPPISKGQAVGDVEVLIDGKLSSRTPLVSSEYVPGTTKAVTMIHSIRRHPKVFTGIIFVGLVSFVYGKYRRKDARAKGTRYRRSRLATRV